MEQYARAKALLYFLAYTHAHAPQKIKRNPISGPYKIPDEKERSEGV
jgi:hypothetical protein